MRAEDPLHRIVSKEQRSQIRRAVGRLRPVYQELLIMRYQYQRSLEEMAGIRRLARVLADWQAYLRGVEPGLPWVMDEQAFRVTPVMTLITSQGAIDLMDRVPGVGDYARVLAASIPVRFEEMEFRVLSLPALISSKRATGRTSAAGAAAPVAELMSSAPGTPLQTEALRTGPVLPAPVLSTPGARRAGR